MTPSRSLVLCLVAALGCAPAALGVSEQRAPNYADPSGKDWLYNHAILEKREAQEPTEDPGVDLFYLLPTTGPSSSGAVDYICSIDDSSMRSTARSWWGATGAVFGGFTHVYAPFYRQVLLEKLSALYSQYTWWEANARYSDYIHTHAGFDDACAALDHYFTHYNPGAHRPFILAGASQGSALIYELLEHYFTRDKFHKSYLRNLVAVYALGYGLDHARMAHIKASTSLPGFEGVSPATNAVDSGVLISWNTVGLGNINNVLLPKDTAVVINPLTWTTNGVLAEKELNLGAYDFYSKTSTPGLYDAQVDTQRGTVICRTMPDGMKSGYGAFGPNSFHERDTMAYWVNIQTNALMRLQTHLQKTSGLILYCR